MGSLVCQAVDAADDLDLVAMVGSGGWPGEAGDAGAQVVVDFTRPNVVMENLRWCIEAGISAVVGTSGFDAARLDEVRAWLAKAPDVGVIIAPNFAVGAVLAMEFAARAAAYFESVEIVEQHHPGKLDAPGGTARHTAELIAATRRRAGLAAQPDATIEALPGARGASIAGVPVHAMRIRGLVAHQETWLGNTGESLTIRHDAYDRSCYMPGVLLAIRAALGRPGLTLGLEHLLDLR
jgi:4-hydroxy-tetrahydrodipicolinate reductase